MVPVLQALIQDALDEAKKSAPSREMSLTITKLEEALMWFKASMK